MNLTLEEQERKAWVEGNCELVSLLAKLIDAPNETTLQDAYDDGAADGYKDGYKAAERFNKND